MQRKLLVMLMTVAMVFAMVIPAMANGHGATVSAVITGGNANQGQLEITVTDAFGAYELTVQSPGNNTIIRDIEGVLGTYTVRVVISGNRVTDASITNYEQKPILSPTPELPSNPQEPGTGVPDNGRPVLPPAMLCPILGCDWAEEGAIAIPGRCLHPTTWHYNCTREGCDEVNVVVAPALGEHNLVRRDEVPVMEHETGTWVWIMVCANAALTGCDFNTRDCYEHNWDDGVITIPGRCFHSNTWEYTCLAINCTETKTVVAEPFGAHDLVRREYGQWNGESWTPIERWEDGNLVWIMACANPGCDHHEQHCYNCENPVAECNFDCLAPYFVNARNARFISFLPEDGRNNARVWILTFSVERVYSDGSTVVAQYSANINASNANQSGRHMFGVGHELEGHALTFDIRGNGSNIREFRINN